MSSVNRLNVPSFDLTWLDMNDGLEPIILIPGGGGSTKSGVLNQIQVAQYEGKKGFKLLKSHMTDSDGQSNFCSAVTTGLLDGKPILCAVMDSVVQVLVAERVDEEIKFTKKTEFKADFDTTFASVNCCIVGSRHIITGGEDRAVRVWSVRETEQGEVGDAFTVAKVREMHGHTAPIMALSKHPSRPWLATASKDGSCKIWDASNGQELINLPCVSGVDSRASQAMECRGCVFSPFGEYIFSIQSAKKGPSHVIKWAIDYARYDSDAVFKVSPEAVILAAKVPLTKLRISNTGLHVATGGSDGIITIYDTVRAKKVSSFTTHDLPVTGLAFSPETLTAAAQCIDIIVSCSADNKLGAIRLYKPNPYLLVLLLFVVGILLLGGYLYLITI